MGYCMSPAPMNDSLPLLVAFLVSAGTLPLLARAAGRWGLVDVPGARSIHATPVARIGGCGLLLGLGAGIATSVGGADAGLDAAAPWVPYLLPALAYFGIGLLDDRRTLRPRIKFLLQAGAAALAVGLGLRWQGAALEPFGPLSFGVATPACTWLWLVAVVTLVNFLDGLDLITVGGAVVLLGAGAGAGAGPGGGALYAIAGAAVLGLGFWNASPARVFPGDAGTHLLGFLVATLALHLPASGASGTQALPWVAASAPLVPGVIDVGLGLYVKARQGVPLSQAHNQHLSQRLTRRGATHAAVALRYGVLALVALFLVVVVAPRFGLAACLLGAVLVLAWHIGSAWARTRALPYVFDV